ncbi:MAG: undecaprenyldiphospho-muramoylpentapeptide beta-N-acetylglucosaminyltransferase [Gammaproteobacteria bacterium]
MTKIMISAGGTGGHIFPGLAVAQTFLQQGTDVVWIGTMQGMEARLVPAENIPLLTITMQGVRGKGFMRLLKAPWLIMRSVISACKLIKQQKPDVILGMGGYVTAPVGIAARICKTPLVIHEQNAIAGTANKLLSHLANSVCESFPNTFPTSKKVIFSGNPLRPAIISLAGTKKIHLSNSGILKLLVLGGSQGARAINQLIPELTAKFAPTANLQIWHQTGMTDFESTKKAYHDLHVQPQKLEPFINYMALAFTWADLIICRAGATTVAEIAAVGLPAIFIPAPQAVDDHQTANANRLAQCGAAIILPQSKLSCERLYDEIQQFFLQPEKLNQMAMHASELGCLDATTNVVKECRRVMND